MGLLQGSDLDDQGVVGIIDDDVHAREPDHLVQLVAALGYHAVFGHEGTLLDAMLFDALGEQAANLRQAPFGNVGRDFLRYE